MADLVSNFKLDKSESWGIDEDTDALLPERLEALRQQYHVSPTQSGKPSQQMPDQHRALCLSTSSKGLSINTQSGTVDNDMNSPRGAHVMFKKRLEDSSKVKERGESLRQACSMLPQDICASSFLQSEPVTTHDRVPARKIFLGGGSCNACEASPYEVHHLQYPELDDCSKFLRLDALDD
tara:strand:- start:1329 stop:1868 length:540 start_codon:yes stop_codon:yes gene_type:complete